MYLFICLIYLYFFFSYQRLQSHYHFFHWQTDLHTASLKSDLTSLNVIKCLSVCFRPPRDLDSKACVTIGEKVILFHWLIFASGRIYFHLCTFAIPIQAFNMLFLLTLNSYITFLCVFLVPHSESTEVGLINAVFAVKNAPVNITAELNTSDCGETGMPFIAHQAVKIFILNPSNKWNFPLAELLLPCWSWPEV